MYKNLHASLEGDHTPEARSQLASSHSRLGALTGEIGSAEVARAAFLKAHEIRRELAAAQPGDRRRIYDEAIALVELGQIERASNRRGQSLDYYQRAHKILQSLADTNPTGQRIWGDLAWCLGNIGALELLNNQIEKAMATHMKVLEIREKLIERNPGDVSLRRTAPGPARYRPLSAQAETHGRGGDLGRAGTSRV